MSDALALALVDTLTDDALAALARRLVPYLPAAPTAGEDGWLDSKAAAGYLGITPNALHKLTAQRAIRFEQDGPNAKCWFKRSWLDDHRMGGSLVGRAR